MILMVIIIVTIVHDRPQLVYFYTNVNFPNPFLSRRSPSNEQVANLYEDKKSPKTANTKFTKFLDFEMSTNKRSLVVFSFREPVKCDAYQMTTGNDCPERDPREWQVAAPAPPHPRKTRQATSARLAVLLCYLSCR
jgi:hypothetical protein